MRFSIMVDSDSGDARYVAIDAEDGRPEEVDSLSDEGYRSIPLPSSKSVGADFAEMVRVSQL